MGSLIERLAETYMVIIDAPPLLPVTDAGLLGAVSDGALLVVQHGKTLKEQVSLATRNLGNVDATLLGFVMNRVPKQDLGVAVYGYGYGGATPLYGYDESGTRRKPSTGTNNPGATSRPQRSSSAEPAGEPAMSDDAPAHSAS